MSARELVLEPSNGAVTTLTSTETSLTVLAEPTTTITPKQRSFFFSSCTKPSRSEIPIHNVIAATVSGVTVEVSYLKRAARQHPLCMQQVRGDVTEKDVPFATEWCTLITRLAYQGSPTVDSLTFSRAYRLLLLLPRPRRESFKDFEGVD